MGCWMDFQLLSFVRLFDSIPHWFWNVLIGFPSDSELFPDGSPIVFMSRLIRFPIDFEKDSGWTPDCLCKVRFPIDFEMFLIGFSIDAGRTLHGFHIEFAVVRKILRWFWRGFAVMLRLFWKGSGWLLLASNCFIGFSIDTERIWDGFPIAFFRKVFGSDSSLILEYFWSGSTLILNWLRMDSELVL